MLVLKVIQWILGLLLAFYIYKALLGKLKEGDGRKAAIIGGSWLLLAVITSGFIRIQ